MLTFLLLLLDKAPDYVGSDLMFLYPPLIYLTTIVMQTKILLLTGIAPAFTYKPTPLPLARIVTTACHIPSLYNILRSFIVCGFSGFAGQI